MGFNNEKSITLDKEKSKKQSAGGAVMSSHARYVCHTCKTVAHDLIKPALAESDIDGELATTTEMRAFVRFVNEFIDPFWAGKLGITTRDFIHSVERVIEWKENHRFHKLELLRHYTLVPEGYAKEKLQEPSKANKH